MTRLEQDEFWMRRALALARQGALQGEVPVGAVIVLDDQEIGCGFNAPIGRHDPTAHAEVAALRVAAAALGNYRMPGATLYVTLEPCTMCAGALVHARISRLVFGASEPKAGAVKSAQCLLEHPSMNWRIDVLGGVLAEPCGAILTGFFSSRRKTGKTIQIPSRSESSQ